jgi:hypothetical protein
MCPQCNKTIKEQLYVLFRLTIFEIVDKYTGAVECVQNRSCKFYNGDKKKEETTIISDAMILLELTVCVSWYFLSCVLILKMNIQVFQSI